MKARVASYLSTSAIWLQNEYMNNSNPQGTSESKAGYFSPKIFLDKYWQTSFNGVNFNFSISFKYWWDKHDKKAMKLVEVEKLPF